MEHLAKIIDVPGDGSMAYIMLLGMNRQRYYRMGMNEMLQACQEVMSKNLVTSTTVFLPFGLSRVRNMLENIINS